MLLAAWLAGCSSAPGPAGAPRIAFLFDGSSDDADEVTGPALAGLRFAALGIGPPETIQPVDIGLDPESRAEMLGDVADDRGVVAAVVAPWTLPPPGSVERLADAGLPVISLTWAWGAPDDGVWRSLAVDRDREARLLLDVGTHAAGPGRTTCLAGDTDPTGEPLARAVSSLAVDVGAEVRPVGAVVPGRPATAATVAGRLTTLGCDTILWTGGAGALDLLLDADPDLLTVVGTSRLKTEGGIAVGVTHPLRRVIGVCACADITLTTDQAQERFVHDFQTESGSAPGPFAVEAYDAGRLVLRLADGRPDARAAVADALEDLREVHGLLGVYRIREDGTLRSGPSPAGVWRASGSRWLPLGEAWRTAASALPLAAPLPIVRPKTRPRRARIVHQPRGEP